jgi:N-(2-amino-2-carboxyethyl)-L-glutamate synthase
MLSNSRRRGVLSAVGHTPLVRLERLAGESPIEVYGKLEGINPGGSIKDRPAVQIIEDAMQKGLIGPASLVIESSSGNMAIGLAQACRYFGLRFVCVADPKMTEQNRRIVKAYGAEIDLVTEPDPLTGEFLVARLQRVQEIVRSNPGAFWPDQYSNQANADAHRHTMQEIAEALDHNVDFLFCSTSTCGTLRGCAEYVQSCGMKTQIYAVDAVGSIIFGGERKKRLLPGHGAGIRPKLFQACLADRCIHVPDAESIQGCYRLLSSEAILAGGSSGAVTAAFERVKEELLPGSVSVLILPDRGERYLDTIYCENWLQNNFGKRLHLDETAGNIVKLHAKEAFPSYVTPCIKAASTKF